jgi:hypothetical protein
MQAKYYFELLQDELSEKEGDLKELLSQLELVLAAVASDESLDRETDQV